MKTIQDINDAIAEVRNWMSGLKPHEREKKDKDRLIFLNLCKIYLERGAKEEHLKRQLGELQEKCKVIDEGFPKWLETETASGTDKSVKVLRGDYNKETNYKTFMEQITTLEFLLADVSKTEQKV